MPFAGLKNATDKENVIAYLKEVTTAKKAVISKANDLIDIPMSNDPNRSILHQIKDFLRRHFAPIPKTLDVRLPTFKTEFGDSIPHNILLLIFEYLDLTTLNRMEQVSKKWYTFNCFNNTSGTIYQIRTSCGENSI